MIAAAALLVLLGLGLFVAGIRTGFEPYYWACVAACVAAGVLIAFVRRGMAAAVPSTATAPAERGAGSAVAERPTAEAVQASGRELPEPGVEEVEVTDLLLVVDLKDEVLVVDEHPRYHLAGCGHLSGRAPIPLPIDEARGDGFTPCAACEPDRNIAQRARARRKAARG